MYLILIDNMYSDNLAGKDQVSNNRLGRELWRKIPSPFKWVHICAEANCRCASIIGMGPGQQNILQLINFTTQSIMLHPSKTSAKQQKCKPFLCFMHAFSLLAINLNFPFLFGHSFIFSNLLGLNKSSCTSEFKQNN